MRNKGVFAGLAEKIPYLKALGVNCVELMPIFEFDEFEFSREVNGRRLLNCWGYSTIGFFAPKAGYAAAAPFGMEADELKQMIRRFHQNGIEVILDVVFNHTAEGGKGRPTISYKGIDNCTYYMLTPNGDYINFSGCGNTMNCNNPVMRNVVIDCLRYWVSAYHVDGFRFDLALILTRDQSGVPMINPPLLESIAGDAVLVKSLLTSRGIPMLLSGDEFANTQYGNNNAYCQDNAVSWLDWTGLEKHRELYDYVRRLIVFRRAHPVLRANHYDFAHNGGTDRRALTRCGFASNLLLIGFHQPAYSAA